MFYNITEDKFSEDKFSEVYMFIGREKEQQKIVKFIDSGKAMLVYGLRRVGKTTLIRETLTKYGYDYVCFECEKASEESNVSSFVKLINEKFSESFGEYKTFKQVFELLNKHHQDLYIVIDEYSYIKEYYLASKRPDSNLKALELDSELQNIIDNLLTNNKLILCGSSISVMRELLDYKSPLYGRFDVVINLEPFNYLEASEMLSPLSNNQMVQVYSIFGGSPYVLSKYDVNKSLEDNICSLLLEEDGDIYRHVKNNVLNELDKDPDLNSVLDSIKNGDKKYSDIEQASKLSSSGLLDKRLKKLLDLNIIEKKYPIGREGDKRKAHYSLKDNLLRFYYAYIYKEKNRISLLGNQRYYDAYISKSLNEFISRRFENIVKDYFSLSVKKGLYPHIIDIGTYFTPNGEYDCVFQKEDKTYAFYEAKFKKKPLSKGEMMKEIEQIKQIKGIDISEIGFVCSSGFEEKIDNIKYLELNDIFK